MKIILPLALAMVSVAAAEQPPPASCDFDGFDVNSKLAEVVKPTSAYYACTAGKKCLSMILRPGDPVVINRVEGDWTCGYLVARKGSAQGWIHSTDIRMVPSDPNPPLSAWIGEWRQEENRISVSATKTPGTLDLEGEAYWHGIGDNEHSGSLSGEATPSGNKMKYSEENLCVVDLALIGKYLLANDNNMCGGVNVRFWGVWKRSAVH